MRKIKSKIIENLMQTAGPSIKYRIHLELCNGIGEKQRIGFEEEILNDHAVRLAFHARQEDDWLGDGFHGSNRKQKTYAEGLIRMLLEKGLNRRQPIVANALQTLKTGKERFYNRVCRDDHLPQELDTNGASGPLMMRACLLAQAGGEEDFIVTEIDQALKAFKTVLEVKTVDEVIRPYHGFFVFLPGIYWPCIYHLRLLSFTTAWRTTENMGMMVAATRKLAKILPLRQKAIYIKGKGSQVIAPAQAFIDYLVPDIFSPGIKDYEYFSWFHRMELLARMGLVTKVPFLAGQALKLLELIKKEQGWCTLAPPARYFFTWGAYSGLALERDWRSKIRRLNDLSFRSLLIIRDFV